MKQSVYLLASAMASLSLLTSPAYALDFSGEASVGLENTDNSLRTRTNEQDELIVSAGVSGRLQENTGAFTSDISASVFQDHYTEDTFGDETNFNLRGMANWAIVRDRVDLIVQDFYQQRDINSLASSTPNNTQDTNVFSISPVMRFALANRHQLTVTPAFRDFYYEETIEDNQQLALQADWLYLLNRTMNVGAGVNFAETDYEDNALSDHTITSPYVIVSGERAKFDYRLNVGTTEIDRDTLPDEDGSMADLFVSYGKTDRSRITLRLASILTDASSNQFDSLTAIENGDFDNEQITSDVLRNEVMRLQYNLNQDRLSSSAWVELRDLDYKVDNSLDREVQEFGINLTYNLSSLMSASFRAVSRDTDVTLTNRNDDAMLLGVGMGYRLSRQLRTSLDINYYDEESSTLAGSEYEETSIVWRLAYAFGRVR